MPSLALLHIHLNRQERTLAQTADVRHVHQHDLLGVRGQIDMVHYEERLKTVLGREGFRAALDLLTEAAVHKGLLTHEAIVLFRNSPFSSWRNEGLTMPDLLNVLRHDGYLEPQDEGLCFVSGLLEDWWRARHGETLQTHCRALAKHGRNPP